jgi:hypothetical protein
LKTLFIQVVSLVIFLMTWSSTSTAWAAVTAEKGYVIVPQTKPAPRSSSAGAQSAC